MARPKLPEGLKKETLHLTVSKESKEMLNAIRDNKEKSISTLVEAMIVREYRKLVKSGAIKDNEQLKGQISIDDLPKIVLPTDIEKMRQQLAALQELLKDPDLPDKDREIHEEAVHDLRRAIARMK
jgi:hypothetical protein